MRLPCPLAAWLSPAAHAQCSTTFGPPTNFAVGGGPRSVVVGDFNGDTRPDLATTNESSNTVSVLLNTPITQQPAPVSTCPSGTATFTVTAAGMTPFTYQWQIQDVAAALPAWIDLVDGPIVLNGALIATVSGAASPSLLVHAHGTGGNFRCIVTNACGSVTSNPRHAHHLPRRIQLRRRRRLLRLPRFCPSLLINQRCRRFQPRWYRPLL